MCLAAIGIAAGATAGAGTATALGATIVGTVVSTIGTAAGIYQSQKQAQYQAAMNQYQANVSAQQQDLAYQNQQRQAYFDQQQQVMKHIGDTQAQQAAMLAYQKNIYNNNEASNKVYISEQQKFLEAKQKAAFKSVDIYAKQIGGMGKVLSSGAVGKSVGLLAMDSNRQAGRALAEQDAGIRSAGYSMDIGMSAAQNQNESANNQSLSRLPNPVQAPQFAPMVQGFGKNLGLGIPSYNWAAS
jgi:disulfide bond formation protein DsbB